MKAVEFGKIHHLLLIRQRADFIAPICVIRYSWHLRFFADGGI